MKLFGNILKFIIVVLMHLIILPVISFGISNSLFNTNKLLFQIVSLLFSMIFMIVLFLINRKKLIESFKKIDLNTIKRIFIYWLAIYATTVIISLIFSPLLNNIPENESLARNLILKYPLINIITVIIVAPFVEEMVYRFYPRKIFNNKLIFIIVSSLIFGFIHVSNFYTSIESLIHFLQYSIIGSFIAKIYYETDNIFSAIILHSFHNLIALLAFLFL